MLNHDQIETVFDELEIPRYRIGEGSPIDIHCPYEGLHSPGHDHRPSCRLWFDSYPHLYCFHESCLDALRDRNTWLRLLSLGTTDFPDDSLNGYEPGIPGDIAYARYVTRQLPRLIAQFLPAQWPPEAIPMSVPKFLRRLRVFKKDDFVWIGLEHSSGRPMHSVHFRTLAQWEASRPPPHWSFTTGAAYLPGAFSRSKALVQAARALILESDTLTQPETFALARWIEDEFALPLLAVVYSGSKSLHCYFPHPGLDWVDRYRPALLAAGFDHRTLRPSQPIRLANQRRADNGATQSLLWIRPA